MRVDPAVLLDPIARDSARSYSTVDAVTAIEDIEAGGTIDEARHLRCRLSTAEVGRKLLPYARAAVPVKRDKTEVRQPSDGNESENHKRSARCVIARSVSP